LTLELPVPLHIDGIPYATVGDMLEQTGITRQTLWRWRHDGVIPQGRRFRSRQVVFSPEDAEAIRQYANRVEPIDPSINRAQLKLFPGRP
jgi:hypothetical protein